MSFLLKDVGLVLHVKQGTWFKTKCQLNKLFSQLFDAMKPTRNLALCANEDRLQLEEKGTCRVQRPEEHERTETNGVNQGVQKGWGAYELSGAAELQFPSSWGSHSFSPTLEYRVIKPSDFILLNSATYGLYQSCSLVT